MSWNGSTMNNRHFDGAEAERIRRENDIEEEVTRRMRERQIEEEVNRRMMLASLPQEPPPQAHIAAQFNVPKQLYTASSSYPSNRPTLSANDDALLTSLFLQGQPQGGLPPTQSLPMPPGTGLGGDPSFAAATLALPAAAPPGFLMGAAASSSSAYPPNLYAGWGGQLDPRFIRNMDPPLPSSLPRPDFSSLLLPTSSTAAGIQGSLKRPLPEESGAFAFPGGPVAAESLQPKKPPAKRKRANSFPIKLMSALILKDQEQQHGGPSSEPASFAWLRGGTILIVLHRVPFLAFLKEYGVLHKDAKYLSFVRRMSRWGFARTTCGMGQCFHNKCFCEGRLDLAETLTCAPEHRKGEDDEGEDDEEEKE